MSQEQEQFESEESEPTQAGIVGQQQQQPQAEGHAGQGSESIIKQLREWERHRSAHSGGKRRQGPG